MAKKANQKSVPPSVEQAQMEETYSKFFSPNPNAAAHTDTAAFHIFTTVDYSIPTYNSDHTQYRNQ